MKIALVVSDDLRDFIRHLPPTLKGKVKLGLEEILAEPHSGKPLRDDLAGLRSYRIGDIRVVYQIDARTLTLIAVGPRKTVYQKAALELKRRSEQKGA